VIFQIPFSNASPTFDSRSTSLFLAPIDMFKSDVREGCYVALDILK
jgi:hypothetical protein